jgi:hypothetical protein
MDTLAQKAEQAIRELDRRHPVWREHAWAMEALGQALTTAGVHGTEAPFLLYDDLYHIVTNEPGCACAT